MKALWSSFKGLLFLLVIWTVALLPRWIDPALRLWAPGSLLEGELEIESRGWEGPEGNRSRSYVGGTLRVPERGWELPYELELPEATVDAAQSGEWWAMRVSPFPSPAWFEGKAVVARPIQPQALDARMELFRALRGPALALALWLVLALIEAMTVARRGTAKDRVDGDQLEVVVSPAAPQGCGPVALGLGVALLVAAVAGWGAIWWIGGICLLGGLLAVHRGALAVDRATGTFQKRTEFGPLRLKGRWSSLGTPAELGILDEKAQNGNQTSTLVAIGPGGTVRLTSAANAGVLHTAGTTIARFLGVPFRAARLGPDSSGEAYDEMEADDGDDSEVFAGHPPPHLAHLAGRPGRPSRERDVAAVTEPTPGGPPLVSVVGGEPAIPRAAIFGCLALIGLPLIVGGGGWWLMRQDPTALVAPHVANWPAGPQIRSAAVALVARRDDEAAWMALLRVAHCGDPETQLTTTAVEALERQLGVEVAPGATLATRLAAVDAAAAAALGRELGEAGVFEWWGLSPEDAALVDQLSGEDQEQAIAAWNAISVLIAEGAETVVWRFGPAFVDNRHITFVIEAGEGWLQAVRRLDPEQESFAIATGDAIGAVLLIDTGIAPAPLPGEGIRAWWRVAAARGYPNVGTSWGFDPASP